MNKRQNCPPRAWQAVKLGDIATVVMGQSPPGTTYNEQGEGLPFYQGKADFGDVSPTPRVWCSAPKKTAEPGDILLSVRAPVGPTNLASHRCCIGRGLAAIRGERDALTLYLYFWFKHIEPWLSEQGEGSTFKAIGKDILENIIVPLPPLPVQERIVQILQKADEIRRKRKEALELADKILPALFLEMFGDPATNPKGWPIVQLKDVLEMCDSGIWGKRTSDQDKGFFVLRSTNMPLNGSIDYKDVALIEVPPEKAGRYVLQDGDILLNRSSGSREHIGKVSLFRETSGKCGPFLFSNFVQRLRAKRESCTPEYLFFLLRSDFARSNLEKLHATSSGLRNLQMSQYLAQPVPLPPISLQRYFSEVVSFYEEARAKRLEALQSSESMFRAMLSQAFTGELTAEWEAANAEWIAEQQALYERLPRLVVLALLLENAKRASRAAAEVLVTALMKYSFLLQMEGSASRRRFYHFVPYHYGPFAKELYTDLEALQQEGLVRVENEAEEDKTKITVTDPARAEETLAALPDDLKEDVAAIIETYGDLDHNALLETVYERYPAYAKRSRLKRKDRR